MSAAAKLPGRMSVRDFLNWDSGDGLRYELTDGEPRAMAPASTVHGYLRSELGGLIRNHLRTHRPGCKVIANPRVIPHLLSAHNVRVPDLAVTCAPLLPGQGTLPEPLLLIEILSPSNHAQTWSNVWTCPSIPSVQEILVLHSVRVAAELLRRSADGGWPDQTVELLEGTLALTSIGLEVALAELYAGTGLTG